MQENTLTEPTTSYKTKENGQVTSKKQQQTQVEVSEAYFYIWMFEMFFQGLKNTVSGIMNNLEIVCYAK